MAIFTAILPLLDFFRVILPIAIRIHIMPNIAYGSINLMRLPTMPQVELDSDGLIILRLIAETNLGQWRK